MKAESMVTLLICPVTTDSVTQEDVDSDGAGLSDESRELSHFTYLSCRRRLCDKERH